jgi:non-homologous end joining protein Ku
MTEAPRAKRKFDCVKFMREARARITAETADMTVDERTEWFNSKRYSDPVLDELAARIRQSTQTKPTDSRGP